MITKMHFLHIRLNKFLDNLGNTSEEGGDMFHQDIKIMEQRHRYTWDKHMMTDFCWSFQRETSNVHNRKSY